MKYKCGKTFWESDNIGFSKNGLWNIPTEILVDMGAVPVDSELDEKHSTGNSTCGKCGETEGTELCPKCGAESYGNCPCKPKEEKIEMPEYSDRSNYTIASYHNEVVTGTPEFIRWMQQVTNKLNGDN